MGSMTSGPFARNSMEGKAKIDYEAGIESHGVEESGIRNFDGCDRIL